MRLLWEDEPMTQIPLGHDGCDHCPGYGDLYERLPFCRDCDERVCPACAVVGTTRDENERGTSVICKLCDAWQLEQRLNDDESAARLQEACDE